MSEPEHLGDTHRAFHVLRSHLLSTALRLEVLLLGRGLALVSVAYVRGVSQGSSLETLLLSLTHLRLLGTGES